MKWLRPTGRKLQYYEFKRRLETLYFTPVCLLRTCKAVCFEWCPEQHNLVLPMSLDAKILYKTISNQA